MSEYKLILEKLSEMDKRFDRLEQRMVEQTNKLENHINRIEERLDNLEQRVDKLELKADNQDAKLTVIYDQASRNNDAIQECLKKSDLTKLTN